ncbi:MAG: hypothetical protein LBT40_14140, partial [Deltaproteobacteria bacterium]|nr:hypothetical protein [Deltaproteobacteria bacterium]
QRDDGADFLTAIRSPAVRLVYPDMQVDPALSEERDVFEFASAKFPGDRLVRCRNPEVRNRQERKLESLLRDTAMFFDRIKARVASGSLTEAKAIGEAVGSVKNKRGVSKFFLTEWGRGHFDYSLKQEAVDDAMKLFGIFVVRTSLPEIVMGTEESVREYKALGNVEKDFRSMKTEDLRMRPFFHYTDDRIRSHAFIVMLSRYVLWHMKEAWRELTWADPEPELKESRNPALKAQKSDRAKRKEATGMVDDGLKASTFQAILDRLKLSAIVTMSYGRGPDRTERVMRTRPGPFEVRAMRLLDMIKDMH